jgi:hypothetical protein
LLLVRLTCWPPGPLERTNCQSNASAGITMGLGPPMEMPSPADMECLRTEASRTLWELRCPAATPICSAMTTVGEQPSGLSSGNQATMLALAAVGSPAFHAAPHAGLAASLDSPRGPLPYFAPPSGYR